MKKYIIVYLLVLFGAYQVHAQCISSLPDTMGFETEDSVEFVNEWSYDQDYTDTNYWWWHRAYGMPASGENAPHRGDRFLVLFELNEDWLISKCYELDTGKFYKLSFYLDKASNLTWNYNLLLKIGKDVGSDTNLLTDTIDIFDHAFFNGVTGVEYDEVSCIFEVDEPGNYSVGWYFYGDTFDLQYYNEFGIFMDDIIMEEYSCDTLEIDIGDDKSICYGDTVTYKVPSGYSKYIWNSQADTDTFYHATQSGYVYLAVEDKYGCMGYDSAYVTVIQIPGDTLLLSGSTTFCEGESVTAEIQLDGAYCSEYDIQWHPGTSTDSIRTFSDYSNKYSYTISDKSGLCTTYSDSFDIEVVYPYGEQQICLVTVEDGKNKVVWEKEDSTNISYFKIYREKPFTGQYLAIDSLDFDSMSTYVDNNSDPSKRPYIYAISIVDTCGNESWMSYDHQTIHLSMNQGVNGEINLSWTPYDGFEYYTYRLYRDTSSTEQTRFDSVSAAVNNYTDNDPPEGNVYYQVEVIREDPCSPSRSVNLSFSNKADKMSSGIPVNKASLISIYPNPARDMVTIYNPFYTSGLEVYSSLGKKLMSQKLRQGRNIIQLNHLVPWLYYFRIHAKSRIYNFNQVIIK